MKRALAGVAAGLLSVGLTAAPASASSHQFPAQNRPVCESFGGVFTEPNPQTNVCTVTGAPVTVPLEGKTAGKSGRSWGGTVTYVPVTTYTRTVITGPGGPTFVDYVDQTNMVLSCTNPGGQPMEPGQGQCPTTL